MAETPHPDDRARDAAPPARRVLVVANQTATNPVLIAELQSRARYGPVRLHLVVPALNSRLRHWLSDHDDAVLAARERAAHARSVMAREGVELTVEIGDGQPMVAIADALSRFRAEEILISTLPVHRSHWLERDLIDKARRRFDLPVSHVVGAEVDESAAAVGTAA